MIFGRDGARETLDELVMPSDRPGAVLLLRGPAGSGKTALLAEAGAQWRRSGIRVISVSAAGHDGREQLLETARSLLSRHHESGLLDAVAAATRAGTTAPNNLPLAHELTRAIARLASRRQTALVVEDLDRAEPPTRSTLSLLVRGVRAAGSAVLVSSRDTGDPLDLADRTLDLPELAEPDVVSVISRWAGRKAVDPTVSTGLRAALGPLSGNPGTILSTLDSLNAEGRLVVIDGHLCLRRAHEPVALADDHELLCTIRARGVSAERIASSTAVLDDATVDDLPTATEATGVDLRSRGRLLDELIADGVVDVLADGRLRPAVPALGTALRHAADERVRTLPSTLAGHLLQQAERGGPVDRQDLADRLVRADPRLSSPLALDVLITAADRTQHTDPEGAADRYRAAAVRLPLDDPRWPRVLRAAVRFQLRLGRFQEIADDIGAVVTARLADPAWPGADPQEASTSTTGAVLVEVAVCWLAALLYEERTAELQDAQQLFARLAPGGEVGTGDFCSMLLHGDGSAAVTALNQLVAHHNPEGHPSRLAKTVAELLVLLNTLRAEDEDFQRAWQRWATFTSLPLPDQNALREAGALCDRASALELLLGENFGRPNNGPLVAYQKIMRAYQCGDWDTALSTARAMQADADPDRDTPTRQLARVFAAEICAAQGDVRRAEDWLDGIPDDMPGGYLVSWARAGMRFRAGDGRTAVREGWRDYLRHRDAGRRSGLERLLGRLVGYAHRIGDATSARDLFSELESLQERTRTQSGLEALHMTRGTLNEDADEIRRALRLTQDRGDTYRTMVCCMLIAETSGESGPVLRAGYSLAKQLGSSSGRSVLGQLMRGRGLSLPRERSPRDQFSPAERRIIDLVSEGLTNRQIAKVVRISEKTVESRLTRVLAKAGCRSRVELVAAHLEGKLTGATA